MLYGGETMSTREDGWTEGRFAMMMEYNGEQSTCPADVNTFRWNAMRRHYQRFGCDWLVNHSIRDQFDLDHVSKL